MGSLSFRVTAHDSLTLVVVAVLMVVAVLAANYMCPARHSGGSHGDIALRVSSHIYLISITLNPSWFIWEVPVRVRCYWRE